MENLRSFDELASEQQWSAGGKGRTLARLYQAGYPVPDGFVILTAAFADDELTPGAWAQVQSRLSGMRKGDAGAAFAVRSSALVEDSAKASFAGEFETVLDVRTDEAMRDAILTVLRSGRSERVLAYKKARRADSPDEMAVVIQRMVRADVSGVLFTADPVTGSAKEMTGNFVRGLGDQLVSGEATGEEFTFSRPSGEYRGPAELERFGRRLYKLCARLEKELGQPQDIEWAIAQGKLHLLQSRPITTLVGCDLATGEWNDSLTGDFLWSNVNFGEAVPGVMTPLTWTVIRDLLEEWMFLPGHHSSGNIGGRPYLNMSVFASVFQAMGKSTSDLLETMAATVYTRLPDGMEIPLLPLPRWSALVNLPRWVRIQIRMKKGVRDLPAYVAGNPGWCERAGELIAGASTKAELLSLWHDEIKPHAVRGVWIVLGSVSHYADFVTPLRRELTELVGPDDADVLISCSGDEGSDLLANLGPVVGTARVARGEMTVAAYIEQYGHRGPHEFELSLPGPAEDPSWLVRQLEQLQASAVDVEALLAERLSRFDDAWSGFGARYPRRARSFKRRIAKAASRSRMREAARSEYVRDRWIVRMFALRAGELTGRGDDIFFLTIDEVMEALAGKQAPVNGIQGRKETHAKYRALPPYPSIIRGRFDPFLWAADPDRRSDFFDSHAPLPPSATGDPGAQTIKGAAGSAGRVEGIVRRLDSPEDGNQLRPGEILVAVQTDIEWTLLFPRAAAIVTDVGAPLSHAAIVARELGIPAVVGCGNATMRLKTGDRVLVDGGRGTVRVM